MSSQSSSEATYESSSSSDESDTVCRVGMLLSLSAPSSLSSGSAAACDEEVARGRLERVRDPGEEAIGGPEGLEEDAAASSCTASRTEGLEARTSLGVAPVIGKPTSRVDSRELEEEGDCGSSEGRSSSESDESTGASTVRDVLGPESSNGGRSSYMSSLSLRAASSARSSAGRKSWFCKRSMSPLGSSLVVSRASWSRGRRAARRAESIPRSGF